MEGRCSCKDKDRRCQGGCQPRGLTCAGMCVHTGGRPTRPACITLCARARPARHAGHRAAGRRRRHSRPSARPPAPGMTPQSPTYRAVVTHKGLMVVAHVKEIVNPCKCYNEAWLRQPQLLMLDFTLKLVSEC